MKPMPPPGTPPDQQRRDGTPRESGVVYDLPSAEHRKARLEAELDTPAVEIVPEKPGV
ncbi:hypothetical protein [Streptomyces sp. NPDC058671]|uniref:hypothetical protein n=1 Tax=Streptomyces sp. NPDC058671 TaxID=3346590 RepID=UPI0036599633